MCKQCRRVIKTDNIETPIQFELFQNCLTCPESIFSPHVCLVLSFLQGC